jgi:hypothetical protein
MSFARWALGLVIGVILFGIGLFVAVRPLFTNNGVLTGTRWLDFTFAAVFMLRGILNVRTALMRRRQMLAQG